MAFFPLGKGWDGACSGLDGPLVELLPLGEGWDGACSGLDGPLVELLPLEEGWDGAYPWQLCRSCV